MSVEKLILGTAGLSGQPYGRNGRAVSLSEAEAIIERAYSRGIRAFDTAPTYGHAEVALGNAPIPSAVVYTKTTGDVDETISSVRRLGRVPVVLWHNFTKGTSLNPWVSGFTTYSDHDVSGWSAFPEVPIQTDWSILNQRQKPQIARSVFLQGVLAGGPLPTPELQPYVAKAKDFAEGLRLSLKALALHAALQIADKVVVGATSVDEVDEVVEMAQITAPKLFPLIRALDCPDRNLTDPRKWAA